MTRLRSDWVPGVPRPFFHRVQSLRGIGAATVAAWHLSGWYVHGVQLLPHAPWPEAGTIQLGLGRLELALLPGHAALMIFFVISGFVLRLSLEHGPQDAMRATARFHVARLFRVYPIVMVSMVLAALVRDWQGRASGVVSATPLGLSTFVANLMLLDVSLNPVLWAMQVEVLMAPVIVALYFTERRFGPSVLLGVAVVTSALSFTGQWTPWRPLSHNFFAFVLGMLVPTQGRALVERASTSGVRRLLLGAVLGLLLAGPLMGFFSRFTALAEGYLACALICIVAYRPELRGLRVLDVRALQGLGLSSGSYYVLHMPLLVVIAPVVAKAVPPAWSLHLPALAGPVVIALAGAVLAASSLVGYHAIEAPGIALGRLVASRWRLRSDP